jgi:hypothetical protein
MAAQAQAQAQYQAQQQQARAANGQGGDQPFVQQGAPQQSTPSFSLAEGEEENEEETAE